MVRNIIQRSPWKVSHVIFDLDGTLLDTEGVYRGAIAAIAKRFGKVYTSEIAAKVIGTPEKDSSRIAVTEMKLPISVSEFQQEFRARSHGHFSKYGVAFVPGAEALVTHLHRNKIPMAIATSSSEPSVKIKLAKHKDFFKLFSHFVYGGSDPDIKRGKPDPDIFLICASRFPDKPDPSKCLVFEDAPNGVKAAKSAGMQVILIPDESLPKEVQGEATLVLNSLEHVPLEKFGLPALKNQ